MSVSNDAPRDAVAAAHMWVPVDATGTDFYALGSRFGTQAGVLSEVHKQTGHPYPSQVGTGFFDPRCLRWHQLQRTAVGVNDNRLSVQVVNDYEAEYADARSGDAPFGQPEFFTALNRTTREADTQGRVALPSSHRRVIDSEDDRYALALTCRSVALSVPALPAELVELDIDGTPVPPGVAFREAGSGTVEPGATAHGGVTTTAPSVAFGGVTFFGGAAQQAAREALAQGGSVADAARWASAAARGVPRPPLLDRDPGPTSVRGSNQPPVPLEPDRNPGGSVPLLNHPKGYVWSEADRIGLLGTLVVPEGASGSYFAGREGTPIGPLPLRHDAQVSASPEHVGRIVFVTDDASNLPEGTGKPIKGELWADASRANMDTELGLETLQWRPVLKVDADLPPSRPPPPPPPWIDPPPEEDDDETDKGGGKPRPPRPPTGGRRRPRPPRRRGLGESSGDDSGRLVTVGGGGGGTPVPPRETGLGGDGRELPPVADPGSQARDYEGPGAACPNATSGVRLAVTDDHGQLIDPRGLGGVIRVPGGYVEALGYPALTPVDGGVLVGGEEPRRRIPLGLPLPPGGGVTVDPAPDDGIPRKAPSPTDDRGEVPLGLPGPAPRRGGFVFEGPLGGDDGIPRGYEERLARRQRATRARRRREARERREQERVDDLEELELNARRQGRTRFADRVRRARERVEKRRRKRQEREQRRQGFRDRQEAESEARRRKREERREQRRAEREERRRERRAQRRRKRRPTAPQGGYVIDLSDPDAEAASVGGLDPAGRRLLEQDRARARERRRRYLEQHGPSFGDWNVANARLPFFGSPGGPASIEGWAHLATYQLRALQQVVTGAFGGPSYFAGNLGVVHRNRVGVDPTGSRVGAHWTAVSSSRLCLRRGQAPVELVSVLEAQEGATICAREGGVVEVVREHRGEGIEDLRPLVLLENDRGSDSVRADLVSDVERRFYVDHQRRVTACALRAVACHAAQGPLLEVGRIGISGALERFISVEADGTLCVRRGLKLGGQRLEAFPQEVPAGSLIGWVGEVVPEGYEVWGLPPERWLKKTS